MTIALQPIEGASLSLAGKADCRPFDLESVETAAFHFGSVATMH